MLINESDHELKSNMRRISTLSLRGCGNLKYLIIPAIHQGLIEADAPPAYHPRFSPNESSFLHLEVPPAEFLVYPTINYGAQGPVFQ